MLLSLCDLPRALVRDLTKNATKLLSFLNFLVFELPVVFAFFVSVTAHMFRFLLSLDRLHMQTIYLTMSVNKSY